MILERCSGEETGKDGSGFEQGFVAMVEVNKTGESIQLSRNGQCNITPTCPIQQRTILELTQGAGNTAPRPAAS